MHFNEYFVFLLLNLIQFIKKISDGICITIIVKNKMKGIIYE